METEPLKRLITQNTIVSSLLLAGFVLLLLQIPLARLDGLIAERKSNQDAVQQDIASSWGGGQQIAGPFLVIPHEEMLTPSPDVEDGHPTLVRNYGMFLPSRLQVRSVLRPEIRYRGLYEVPLYQADLEIDAEFSRAGMDQLGFAEEGWQWDQARVIMTVQDLKALSGNIEARWGETPLDVMPGSTSVEPGFHFRLPQVFNESGKAALSLRFRVNGSQCFQLAPLGRSSELTMEGAWPSPGFQGEWLPNQRTITESGFSAQWDIPFIARGLPIQWKGAEVYLKSKEMHWVGVQLQPDVDAYRQTERATKYQLLFLLMIFGFFWLFQIVAGIRIHLLHYLLTGGSLCLFYLMLLSLAEHIGFVAAYLCASGAVMTQITLYGKSVLQSWKRAAGLGALLGIMLVYLWSLLQEQDYALLFGSAGLFVSLSLVMFLTRNRVSAA